MRNFTPQESRRVGGGSASVQIGPKVLRVHFDEIAALKLIRAGRNMHTQHCES
jgi:hypothetical protein